MVKPMYRIKWLRPDGLIPVLAVCDSYEECEKIIQARKDTWIKCKGYDITPELVIELFYVEEEEN